MHIMAGKEIHFNTLETDLPDLAFEGGSLYLNGNREGPMKKMHFTIQSNQNLQRGKLYHLPTEMITYGTNNGQTLNDIIQTNEGMNNITSNIESNFDIKSKLQISLQVYIKVCTILCACCAVSFDISRTVHCYL